MFYPWSQTQSPCTAPNAYPGPPPDPYIDCDCKNTAGCIDDPRQTCHDDNAVGEYEDRIDQVLTYLGNAGANASQIAWQVFDTERWSTINEQGWDAAVTAKHNRFYDAGKGKLPNVPIHQYDRAAVYFVDNPTTHAYVRVDGTFYKLDERGDVASVSLYEAHDLKRSKEMLARTAESASELIPEGRAILTPWIGLACGFPELGTGVPFKLNLDYGIRHIRDLAYHIRNLSFESYPRVVLNPIALYPPPFKRWTPHGTRYFIESVRAMTE